MQEINQPLDNQINNQQPLDSVTKTEESLQPKPILKKFNKLYLVLFLISLILIALGGFYFYQNKKDNKNNIEQVVEDNEVEKTFFQLGNFNLSVNPNDIYQAGEVKISIIDDQEEEFTCEHVARIFSLSIDVKSAESTVDNPVSLFVQAWDDRELEFDTENSKDNFNKIISQIRSLPEGLDETGAVVQNMDPGSINFCSRSTEIPWAARVIKTSRFDEVYFVESSGVNAQSPLDVDVTKKLIIHQDNNWLVAKWDLPNSYLYSETDDNCYLESEFSDKVTCLKDIWFREYRDEESNQEWIDKILEMVSYNDNQTVSWQT